MKKLSYLVCAFFIIVSCEKPNKIGFVDNGIVINGYLEKKDLESEFKVRQEVYTKKYDSIEGAFQKEVQKFQSDAQKMSQSKAQEKYQELGQRKQIQDQKKQAEAQEFQMAFRTQLDSIISKVKRYENEYGKTKGYSYILGTSDELATVLFGLKEQDLTQVILDGLNAEYSAE